MTATGDSWTEGDAYEAFMGRWSRDVARVFIEWLNPKKKARWLDIGCGTGALTRTICEGCDPSVVIGCDPSVSFVNEARLRLSDPRVSFVVGKIEDLQPGEGVFDAIVSGLALNFIPEPARAISSMLPWIQAGGFLSAYVWDYAEGMAFLRYFWNEAVSLDPSARELDEGLRFPICRPEALVTLFEHAGLTNVETQPLEIKTSFVDFNDFWSPFLAGTGPAPAYLRTLDLRDRGRLRDRIKRRLPVAADGTILLKARAWGVRGFTG